MSANQPTTDADQAPTDGQFVLVVDDDESVLAMTRAILETAGYAVIPAESGEEAIQIYKTGQNEGYPPPLILLDLTLPGGMNGLETFKLLKEFDENVRAIATSGYFDESAAQAAKRRGFLGILPKPFTAERLMKMVQWGSAKGHMAAAA